MLGGAEGEEKLRLAIEEARRESARFAGADQVIEVDMRRQILFSRMSEKVARYALLGICGGGSEAARTRMKELRLRIAVVECDDQSPLDDVANVGVQRLPLQRDVGELA